MIVVLFTVSMPFNSNTVAELSFICAVNPGEETGTYAGSGLVRKQREWGHTADCRTGADLSGGIPVMSAKRIF